LDPDREREWKGAARRFFTGTEYAPATARQLAEALSVPSRELPAFTDLLHELEDEGIAVHLDGRGWFAPRREGWLAGTLIVNRRGFGFVRPADEDPEGDIFIPASRLADAHHGDLVLVEPRIRPRQGRPRPEGPGREGRVLHVLRRSPRVIVGRFWAEQRGGGVIEPLRHESVREIHVEPGLERGAVDGERVLARLRDGPSVGGLPPGEVVAVAFEEGTWRGDLQLVAAEYGLEREFPAEVESAAAAIPAGLGPEELARRADRRELPLVTIDPSDAKDHDDAVAIEELPGGAFRLAVAIADVSHYVRSNDPVDKEAYRRATSVYLPGLTVPMLPERLSTDLCSLRPDEDRLAKIAWIDFEPDGRVRSARVEKAVIRSHRRFSYSEVQELLDGAPPAPEDERFLPALGAMDRLRALLHARRLARGALDLELEEMRLRLDEEGEVLGIEARGRDRSHHLIEEFMLAANEAVARIASERGIAILRRVHDEPADEDVQKFLKLCRVIVPGVRVESARDLPRLAEALRGESAAPVVQYALLRTLTRAEYSAEKALHFALATDEYCHFTSPIRRYPDLQVHRALDDALFGGRRTLPEAAEARLAGLGAQAEHASSMERNAEEAEREMSKLRAISWLRLRIGERFAGVISAVRDNGFYVRLDDFLIDGFVHIRTLRDDLYVFSESQFSLRGRNAGRILQLGDPVEVRLAAADPLHRSIDLRYLQHLYPAGERGTGEKRGKGKKAPKVRKGEAVPTGRKGAKGARVAKGARAVKGSARPGRKKGKRG